MYDELEARVRAAMHIESVLMGASKFSNAVKIAERLRACIPYSEDSAGMDFIETAGKENSQKRIARRKSQIERLHMEKCCWL